WVEPPQVAIIILDLKVSGIGSCGGHVMACEAAAPVAMAVEDVPEVSEDLEGDPTAKAPPRCPGCRVHVLSPPRGRLCLGAPGRVIAPARRAARSCGRHRRRNTGPPSSRRQIPGPPGSGGGSSPGYPDPGRRITSCHLAIPEGRAAEAVSAQHGRLCADQRQRRRPRRSAYRRLASGLGISIGDLRLIRLASSRPGG